MTHDPVQSDLELANRLLKAGCPDPEIATVLTARGLEPAKAAQLVADLRSGKTITLETPFGSETGDLLDSEDVIYPEEPSRSWRLRLLLLLGLALVLGGLALAYYFHNVRAGVWPGS